MPGTSGEIVVDHDEVHPTEPEVRVGVIREEDGPEPAVIITADEEDDAGGS